MIFAAKFHFITKPQSHPNYNSWDQYKFGHGKSSKFICRLWDGICCGHICKRLCIDLCQHNVCFVVPSPVIVILQPAIIYYFLGLLYNSKDIILLFDNSMRQLYYHLQLLQECTMVVRWLHSHFSLLSSQTVVGELSASRYFVQHRLGGLFPGDMLRYAVRSS